MPAYAGMTYMNTIDLDPAVIGSISLNISFVLYLSLLAPQLFHNYTYRNTQHLSWGMHYAMFTSYIFDLLYGFGRHMQWQYKTVTIIGLICLTVQHIQIYRYSGFTSKQQQHYWWSTGLLISLFISVVIGWGFFNLSPTIFIGAGAMAQIGWLIYVIPQIFKNHRIQSTAGISVYFVLLLIFLATCDTISAWTLGWDWPNKYGTPVGIILRLILLYQFYMFARTTVVSTPYVRA